MPSGGWLTLRTYADGDTVVVEVGGHRPRHPPRGHQAHLRPVLHHQGHRHGAPGSAWPSPTASCRSTAARSSSRARRARAPPSRWRCPPLELARRWRSRMRCAESILVVDDEEVMRDVLRQRARPGGLRRHPRGDAPSSASRSCGGAASTPPSSTSCSPSVAGLEVLEELEKHDPELVVLMITAFASIETAIDAMKKGAFDYVTEALQERRAAARPARTASTSGASRTRTASCARPCGTRAASRSIVGKSPKMQQVFQPHRPGRRPRARPSSSSGESGTGKELVAKAVHANSPRRDKPFVVVNSGSPPPRAARERTSSAT